MRLMRSGGCWRRTEPGCVRYALTTRHWSLQLARCCSEAISKLTPACYQAPEIQTMYSVPKPVSTIRTRIRQEFERNRFVNKLSVIDVLIFRSHADYQVSYTTIENKTKKSGRRASDLDRLHKQKQGLTPVF
jgi:hypothetical protein